MVQLYLIVGRVAGGAECERGRERAAWQAAAVERGVTSFDSAEMYPVPQSPRTAGGSEAVLGSWLGARIDDDGTAERMGRAGRFLYLSLGGALAFVSIGLVLYIAGYIS